MTFLEEKKSLSRESAGSSGEARSVDRDTDFRPGKAHAEPSPFGRRLHFRGREEPPRALDAAAHRRAFDKLNESAALNAALGAYVRESDRGGSWEDCAAKVMDRIAETKARLGDQTPFRAFEKAATLIRDGFDFDVTRGALSTSDSRITKRYGGSDDDAKIAVVIDGQTRSMCL